MPTLAHSLLPSLPPSLPPFPPLSTPIRLPSFQIGFTIEGRDDAELPEVMLAVARFNYIDVTRAYDLV